MTHAPPIESHAVIGNKRTAALVADDGTIDWWCPQRFDSPSVFAALLDPERGGAFTLRPQEGFRAERRYRPGTNVLETTFTTRGGRVRVTDAMALPLGRALDYNQIVRRVDGLEGEVALRWRVEPRFGYGQRPGRIGRRGDAHVISDPHGPTLAVQAHGAGEPTADAGAVGGAFTCAAGDTALVALGSFDVGPLALSGAGELAARLEATAAHWEHWAADCPDLGRWTEPCRRSALALDLMVDESSGAIIAAPTMALPERAGGERNYDYRYTWLRDANLTLEAMLRLGFTDQVHASLRWMFEATDKTHPRLHPMFRIDGRATLQDHEVALRGWRGSQPVQVGNSAQSQLQLDAYADVFDMVWRYVDAGNALTDEAALRMAEMADFACLVWRHPDAGIWELPEPAHHTQSKLACALALRRAGELAAAGVIPADHADRWAATRQEIRGYVHERCWSPALAAYTGTADTEELDAAVLLSARGGLLHEEPERLSSTIDAIRRELGAGGPLLYRTTGLRGREGAFLACSFWLVQALTCCGRSSEAEATLDELVALANDVGLYAEEVDPATGGFRGNFPQALTHLALVNAADACVNAGSSAGKGTLHA